MSFLTVGCGKPKIETVRAFVTGVDVHEDTLKSMKVQTTDGEKVFKLDDVRFNEGIMMKGDSIIIDYIKGKTDTLRALVVTVLPKAPHYVDVEKDTTQELLTVPADKVKKTK